MYQLQLLNVVKIVDDERKRDKLIAQGYKLIEPSETSVDSEQEVEPGDDSTIPSAGRGSAKRNKEAE